MTDPSPIWVMYSAKYDVGRQHSRIIPDSVRVILTSYNPISAGQVEAERDRIGLGSDLTVMQMDVPADIPDRELAVYATQQIANEPEFDFWDEVIGDDLVVEGIAYSGDLYTPDGEGGVRRLTEDEHAARERRDIADEAIADVTAGETATDRDDYALPTSVGRMAGQITQLKQRAMDLRVELAGTAPQPGVDGQTGADVPLIAHVDDVGPDPPDQPDMGL